MSLTEKYAKDINLLHELRSFDCVSCKLAKAKRKKVPRKTETRAGKLGERLFIDLSGPFLNSSYGGSQYAMVIVDDFSRYKWTKFLKNKMKLARNCENYSKNSKARIRQRNLSDATMLVRIQPRANRRDERWRASFKLQEHGESRWS